MRLRKLGCAVVIIALPAVDSAEARQLNGDRAVHIITMASAPGAPASSADIVARQEDIGAASQSGFSTFRAHDLSRRWVEFEMDSSFALSKPVASAAAVSSALAVGRLDEAQQLAGVPPAPIVSIPDWMRAGLALTEAETYFKPGCAAGEYRPTGFLAKDAEGRRLGYYAMMSDIACEYGIPVGLFDAMIIRESRYRADIFSPKNAYGLTQLMPGTAAGLGVDRYDVEQNLRGGARYLRQQLDRFGQVHLALAAYNAGPGRVRNGLIPRIAETQAYVGNVLLNWRRLAGFSPVATVENADVAAAAPKRSGRIATIFSY